MAQKADFGCEQEEQRMTKLMNLQEWILEIVRWLFFGVLDCMCDC